MSRVLFAASVLALTSMASVPASALTAKECSDKYQAAKAAGTLGDQKWNDFRKAQCGADAKPEAAAPPPAPAPTPAANAEPPKTDKPAAAGAPIFPAKVDPKYASESEGKQRQKTCLDQYKANKANGGNGGLNWIEKGGGYYSECNKKLKG